MFNTSVARLMELYNALTDYLRKCPKNQQNNHLLQKIFQTYIILISPYLPHFAEEWWEKCNKQKSIFLENWPSYKEEFLSRDEISMAVMINGKFRQEG